MPDIAQFEYSEQWGGQAVTWIRLHKPDCHVHADYYGVSIAGAWDHMSVDERRALVVVLESALRFHTNIRVQVDKTSDDKGQSGGIWTGKRYSDLGS